MFRDWCICLLVLAVYSCAVAGMYTLTGPTSAAEGSTVTFTCTTSPVEIGVSWKETSGSNTNTYIYSYNSEGRCQRATGTPPSDYIFDCNSTGMFSLSFPADYSRHRGSVFRCGNAVGPGESNNITLSVTVPLTSVTLLNATNSPLTVVQGTDVTLVCETNPTDPESTISWRRDGQSVSQGVTSSTRQETEGVVTVSVWSQRVQWTDRGTYSCEANSSGVTRTSRDLTLTVQVPVSSVTLTNITSNNQQVPVNQDSSLVLTCQTSPAYPAPTVTWYVRSSMTSSGVDSRTDTQTSGQIVTVSTVTRTMRKNNDQDTFYCQAENINGEAGTQSKTARANVFYGPDANMTNLTKPAVIAERNNVNLTCSTLTQVNPEVDFIWSWGDNTAITAGLGNKQGLARGTWSQTLTVRAVRDSNRQEIRCDVINTQTSRMERVVVDLDISFGPDSVQVSKSSTAVELEPLSLTCSTTNNVKPGVTFTWTVDGSEVTSGTGQKQGSSGGNWSQTLTLTPNRNQSSVGCTVINTVIARKESGSVDLDVNYPPDISLSPVEGPQNTDMTLTCTATGNPSNYMFEEFRQYWGDQLIQRRGGTQTGDRYSLDLPQVSYQDSGVYVCNVRNNVKQPSHKNTSVTVQASPVYSKDADPSEPVGAELGQTMRLVQYVYCSPNFTSVSWYFNTTNTTSRLSTDSSNVNSSLVHLDVHGTQVEAAGFKLVYTVTNFKQEHVGLYTVRVCNRVGCAESSRKLIGSDMCRERWLGVPRESSNPTGLLARTKPPWGSLEPIWSLVPGYQHVTMFQGSNVASKRPPKTPLQFTALNSTTDSVTLTWTPQYAGGDYTQEFHVEFRVQNTSGDWSSRVFPLSQDNSGAGVVDGLDSNTGYVFRIKSVTDRKTGNNQSPVSEKIYFSTKEVPKVPPPAPLGAIAGGVVGGLAFLILVAVLLVFLWRKKQSKGGDRERLGSGDRNGEILMEPNVLYETSGNVSREQPVMQKNDIYESADAVGGASPVAPGKAGAFHSEVKKKKPEESVSDVYSEVKKTDKMQQKKKDAGKKDKGKKKDATPAAKAKRARGDVYENAMPGQYGDDASTYANAGFEGDEPEAKNENPQPPTGRDADGCLYVGIDFGNKKPGKVIIGDEKSPYADIAFGRVGPPPAPDEDEEKKKDTASK